LSRNNPEKLRSASPNGIRKLVYMYTGEHH